MEKQVEATRRQAHAEVVGPSRRTFVRTVGVLAGAGLGGVALAACQSAPAPATQAPSGQQSGTTQQAAPAAKKSALIRFSQGGTMPPGEMEPLLSVDYVKQNILKNHGKSYTTEFTQTKSTPEVVSLLAAGQLDLGPLAYSSLASAVTQQAVPGGITVVGDVFWDGRPGFYSFTWITQEDSGIKTIQDLKGKKVAVNAFGTGVDLGMRVTLRKNNIDPQKDIQAVEIGFPNIGQALREKRVDCGVLAQPFYSQEMAKGGLRPVFKASEGLAQTPFLVKVVRSNFLKENPDAVRGFLEDYLIMLKWFLDSGNRPKAIEIMSEMTKTPKETLDLFYNKPDVDFYRDPGGCLTPAAIQAPIDLMVGEGFIKEKPDISKYVDLSYLPGKCA